MIPRHLSVAFALAMVACNSEPPPSHPTPTDAVIKDFDGQNGQLPEGLVIAGNDAYVGFAPTGAVGRVDLTTGTLSDFGHFPAPVQSKGFLTGLARDAQGNLYGALVSFVPEVQAGIYRIPPSGGAATLFAHDPNMNFPNGLVFDASGVLFATDSASGSVFRIDAGGAVERWVSGDLLTGNKDACAPDVNSLDVGANGIAITDSEVYVANNDKATVLKIPRLADGKAGAATIVAGPDCKNLGGADGILRQNDGSFLVAVNRKNMVVRVDTHGQVTTLRQGGILDFPATLVSADGSVYATNFALANASSGKPAKPGLLRIAITP
jgi:sugar lactone lactonase YvrE